MMPMRSYITFINCIPSQISKMVYKLCDVALTRNKKDRGFIPYPLYPKLKNKFLGLTHVQKVHWSSRSFFCII